MIQAKLETDSLNYEVITEGVLRVVDVPGMTCEIGLRRGGGSYYIIDALKQSGQQKVHLAIDPYGNIEYATSDTAVVRYDYTNTMRDECLFNMYLFCSQVKQDFLFFPLEDTEFFARYGDGVPVYNEVKQVLNEYSFVHFDGPHATTPLLDEIDFFHARTPKGAVFVFDDVAEYDHATIDRRLVALGWENYRQSQRKWAYVKG